MVRDFEGVEFFLEFRVYINVIFVVEEIIVYFKGD